MLQDRKQLATKRQYFHANGYILQPASVHVCIRVLQHEFVIRHGMPKVAGAHVVKTEPEQALEYHRRPNSNAQSNRRPRLAAAPANQIKEANDKAMSVLNQNGARMAVVPYTTNAHKLMECKKHEPGPD